MSSKGDLQSGLSLQEFSHLHDRKNLLKETHLAYLQQHPELRSILADFTTALLLEKPIKLYPFATEHFAALATSNADPPMLVHGAPILVIAGARKFQVLEMLNERFPGSFMAPVMTTTRPPHRGERPGITMNFATVEMIDADRKAGKYLETGATTESGCEGELIGTTLEAIARIKARCAIPLLHVSYERAVAARACDRVKPSPWIILVCDGRTLQEEARMIFDEIIYANDLRNSLNVLGSAVGKRYADVVSFS